MRKVTLSFDNGPTPGVTEAVLEILKARGIRATFFVIGRKLAVPGAMEAMRAANRAGHWIGNHTLTHAIPFGERPNMDFAAAEIGETEALIGELARPEKLFRPYGRQGAVGPHLFSRAAVEYLLEHHYRCLLWNAVPGDWRDQAGWVERLVMQVAAQDWSLVVLHDIENAALPRLTEALDRLEAMGVEFVQAFAPEMVQTDAGRIQNLNPAYVIDGLA